MNLHGYITEDGKLSPLLKERLAYCIKVLSGKNISIDIKEKKKQRSNPQNAYFHVLVGIFQDELKKKGNDFSFEYTKDFVKLRLIPVEVVDEPTGEIMRMPGYTHLLNQEEFGEMIERFKAWATEWDIILPEPFEQLEILPR